MNPEITDVVDENDVVIGQEDLSRKEELDFISRAVVVFVRDSEGNLIVCKRSPDKQINPGLYDVSVAGHSHAGESYEQTAHREMMEELGVQEELKFLFKTPKPISVGEQGFRYFTTYYETKTDDEIILNDEATEFVRISVPKLKQWIQNSPEVFCPIFLQELKLVKELLN